MDFSGGRVGLRRTFWAILAIFGLYCVFFWAATVAALAIYAIGGDITALSALTSPLNPFSAALPARGGVGAPPAQYGAISSAVKLWLVWLLR